MTELPRILCIGGHDPSGGAGIQADIETISALGGRAVTLLTCLTDQDTRDIHAVHPVPRQQFATQLQRVLDDMDFDAVKLGVLGAPPLIEVVAPMLEAFDGPVVLDPVLAAGGGFDIDGDRLGGLIRDRLLPGVTLATPNRAELRRLAGSDDEEAAVARLLGHGTGALLVTGADEAQGDRVCNVLHRPGERPRNWCWPRLPHHYHGSGCTLASACAVGLAAGLALEDAVERAQEFTWRSLQSAEPVGQGQRLPTRRP